MPIRKWQPSIYGPMLSLSGSIYHSTVTLLTKQTLYHQATTAVNSAVIVILQLFTSISIMWSSFENIILYIKELIALNIKQINSFEALWHFLRILHLLPKICFNFSSYMSQIQYLIKCCKGDYIVTLNQNHWIKIIEKYIYVNLVNFEVYLKVPVS